MSGNDERRAAPRRECLLCAVQRPVGDDGGFWPALIQDISRTGASLIVDRPVTVNASLAVRVRHQDRQAQIHCQLFVKHIQPHGEAAWIVGGSFERELERAEYDALR